MEHILGDDWWVFCPPWTNPSAWNELTFAAYSRHRWQSPAQLIYLRPWRQRLTYKIKLVLVWYIFMHHLRLQQCCFYRTLFVCVLSLTAAANTQANASWINSAECWKVNTSQKQATESTGQNFEQQHVTFCADSSSAWPSMLTIICVSYRKRQKTPCIKSSDGLNSSSNLD